MLFGCFLSLLSHSENMNENFQNWEFEISWNFHRKFHLTSLVITAWCHEWNTLMYAEKDAWRWHCTSTLYQYMFHSLARWTLIRLTKLQSCQKLQEQLLCHANKLNAYLISSYHSDSDEYFNVCYVYIISKNTCSVYSVGVFKFYFQLKIQSGIG